MPRNAVSINLTDEENQYLKTIVHKGTVEARVYSLCLSKFLELGIQSVISGDENVGISFQVDDGGLEVMLEI